MRGCLAVSCLLVLGLPVAAQEVPGGGIGAEALSRHVAELSSDAYAGRAPATDGERRTVDYLVAQFKRDGLQPGGERGGWTQDVTLVRAEVQGQPVATVRVGGQASTWRNGEDVTLQSLYPATHIALQDAPLVFVGYGVNAPERHWDDYKGVDLAGKVAVVLINDPDFETPQPGAFDGKGMTYYGRWTYKYEELARKGAAGVLIVHETAPAAYGWATVKSSGTSPLFDIPRDNAAQYHTRLRGWLQRDAAVALFKHAGLDFEALKAKAQRADFKPVELGDARLSTVFEVKREQVTSHNVIAKLPGAQRPSESVIYSAHWDAYGIGAPDEAGDAVRHGAVDNATGVAAVLELARVFAAGPRPARTTLFMALTAEEKGLLGATYYAAHPLMPLARTAAVINIEMLSPDGPTRDIASWGRGRVSLEHDLAMAAKARGKAYSPDPNLEAGFFYRADHFAFAQKGVPAITVGAGLDRVDGGVAKGKALRDAYFARCYHQPCDKVTARWDASGQAQDVTILYDLGRDIANGDAWPVWQADSEFSGARAASADARTD
ncbi:Zn-dependent amino-or carboxypeptidase, M28 family [Pseudoxanthomonas sp. GM95]|uniref:M28 family metallopeptidase n=1 Tax=Pseudoxanthomonas sp. GM95 TaxID=1881043 RepID=UPI0008D7219C|nr:M28 family metallopeptidase [Pseudoxanthomonas sp. GM95]SEK38772.1 Zn-dependent amino-or carboxypeptidase, M28 family [Pseudoxanthomonas sp. GM95]